MEHGRVPDTVNHFDTVALPSEMPIGSLVHLQNSTTYGVIKITNIPYSITKSEIHQFIGRDAPLVSPIKGCAVHIIMERPTAKTMDCYVEFETKEAAKVIQTRLTAMVEQGHRRLGSRHVDVELSSEDELLKDLFPRAKCVEWKDGKPHLVENTDPFSTGFTGFFTNEEIVNAIRHAENPQRSPFCNKCPQRTYESTISTLYKFPWHETHMYTVGDRNLLFELTSRQIKTLASRVKNSKTVGLDQRLLRDLLHAGLRCPSFNERMKYTLCFYSEDIREITRFSEAGKWFPFDTLVRMPGFNEATMMHYAKLITKGSTVEEHANAELPNSFPPTINLQSPYGRIWYEWSLEVSKYKSWESAVQREMVILCNLVLAGWIQAQRERNPALANGDDEALGAISSTTASAGSAPGPVGLPTINVTQANNGVPVNPYFLPEFTQLGGNTHANNYNGPQVNAGHGNAVVNPGFPFAPAGFGL
ncbi:hypothetical protein ASPZODRAFT_75128 [Penicilliopsis zonata CBS 506.65]|uniref:RRM domain-containing protein n=1 Tax=Penicilliopsis zonata CBS 506.65 TaxID=1073090 RepID=A0A1L9S7H1_9EURO|nr:hypothetical protein ASPZODRAFT_75128 [Penicilliopsis zonata CBS 506.65]OJJ43106.1 hypothetical protein ASPZODRAFT_75128 [Penicilliopsis zonata CBS 506.65]